MRVLFVTHTAAMQGANTSLLRLMVELRRDYGVDPVVLMPRIHPAYARRNMLLSCREEGIECHSMRYHWFKNNTRLVSYLRCLSNIISYPLALFRVRRLGNFDLIHSNGSVVSLGAFLSRWLKVPHVWHLREFGDLDFGLRPLPGQWYERWVYRRGDVFIAISEAVRRHFQKVIPAEKIRLVYNGISVPPAPPVPHNAIPQWATPQSVEAATVQFCQVGLVSQGKNQGEALRATDILVNEWGVWNFHVTIIGFEEKEYTARLRAFVGERGLDSFVTFLGERSDARDIMGRMDVGLMLSVGEAFGRVTVEYMLQEMPVIATASGANAEIVADGVTGLTYTLGDPEALAQCMKSLIESPEVRAAFGAAGRNRALSLFSSGRNTKEVFAVYSEVTPG